MELERFGNGSVEFVQLPEGDERNWPPHFQVHYTISTSDAEAEIDIDNTFRWTVIVPGGLDMAYAEVEELGADRLVDRLRALADAIEASVAETKAERAATRAEG